MVAEKSMRATKIASRLGQPGSDASKRALTHELQSLYPQYHFSWEGERGLHVHMPIGSIRMPRAIWYVASVVTQATGAMDGPYTFLKNRFAAPEPEPEPPRTWYERLGEEFD